MKNSQSTLLGSVCKVLTIVLALFFSYQYLPSTFFQQDEWQYFGLNIYAQVSGTFLKSLLLPQQGALTHFFPFATLLFYLEYLFFGVNASLYLYLNLILHAVNTWLLFVLVNKLTKNSLSAYFAAILFSIYSLAHQPVTWIAAGIGTIPNTLFLLLSLLLLLTFLRDKSKRSIVLCLTFVLVSILFKEVSLFLLGFLPLFWILFEKKHTLPPRQLIFPIGLVFILYIGLRIVFFLGGLQSEMPEIGDVSAATPATYLFRLFTVPLKALTQSIVPDWVLLGLSDVLVRVSYPFFIGTDGAVNPYVSQSIVFDLVGYGLAIAILLFAYCMYKIFILNKQKQLAFSLLWSLGFIVMASIPYIFIPGRAGYFSIFEPRNLYVLSIGTTTLLALMFTMPFSLTKKPILRVTAGVIFMIMIIFHVIQIRSHVEKLVEVGVTRKRLVETIVHAYPSLPERVIVFTQSDSSYYGLPVEEKILPVQSGFGRMLMVWYQESERFPACLYAEQFLHGLPSQGYKECEGRGFGYVRQYEVLLQMLKDESLLPANVISYSWNSQKKQFSDITDAVRTKLFQDIQL